MNPEHISPKQLKIARNNASLSQEFVASELGLPRTAITLLEAGKRKIKGVELTKLAELYGRPIEWFCFESEEDLATAKMGRKHTGVNDQSLTEAIDYLSGDKGRLKEGIDNLIARDDSLGRVLDSLDREQELTNIDRKYVHRALMLCFCASALDFRLGSEYVRTPVNYSATEPLSTAAAIAQGETYAEMERQRLGIGHNPISDIQALVASQGIWATSLKFPGNIYGVYLSGSILGEVILVNSAHKHVTQRMAMAQGYAHRLFDSSRFSFVSSKDTREWKVEQRANGFASTFLLPERGVSTELARLGKGQAARTFHRSLDAEGEVVKAGDTRRSLDSQQIGSHDISYIANRYDVSSRLATHRIARLGYINEKRRDFLEAHVARGKGYKRRYMKTIHGFKDGGRRKGKGPFAPELQIWIAHTAIEAHRRGRITEAELLELSKPLRDLSSEMKADPEALLKLAKSL